MPTKPPLNSELLSLVKGKTVALVGPAAYLTKYQAGALIDSYDIVCHINTMAPRQKVLQASYGARTDILIHNFSSWYMRDFRKKLVSTSNQFKKVKMILAPSIVGSTREGRELRKKIPIEAKFVTVKINMESINKYDTKQYSIDLSTFTYIRNEILSEVEEKQQRNNLPTTGVVALKLLSMYPVKSLFLTGFSFYQEGGDLVDIYRPGYMKGRALRDVRKSLMRGKKPGHGDLIEREQLTFVKDRLLPSCRSFLQVDSHANQLLDLDHTNVVELPPIK